MAITDAGKLFETTSLLKTQTIAVGAACKAGSLVVIFIGGEKSGTLGVSSISDSRGNTWQIVQNPGSTMVAILISRLSVALASTDTVTMTLTLTPGVCWKSAHNFENADDAIYDSDTNAGTSAGAHGTVAVTGSDWLALGMAYWPSDALMTTTELDSSVSQDTGGSTDWSVECWSCNGTSGTSTRIGATTAAFKYRKVIGISLLFRAMNTAKAAGGIFMGI